MFSCNITFSMLNCVRVCSWIAPDGLKLFFVFFFCITAFPLENRLWEIGIVVEFGASFCTVTH